MRVGILTGALLAFGAVGQASAIVFYAESDAPIAANTADDAGVECPFGSHALGGGAFLSGTDLETEIESSVPYDSGDGNHDPDNGWAVVGNAGANADVLEAHVYCSDKGPFKYVKASQRVSARETEKAHCPNGTRVVGGGVGVPIEEASPLIRMVASEPLGLGTPSKSDDGWRGSIDNASAGFPKMTTWAVCAHGAKTKGFTSSNGIPVFANNTQDSLTTPACPENGYIVTGGGGHVQGTPGGTEIATLYPRYEDNAWRTYFNNESGFAQQMSVTSVCTKNL